MEFEIELSATHEMKKEDLMSINEHQRNSTSKGTEGFFIKKKKTGVRINQLLLVRYPMNVELINF